MTTPIVPGRYRYTDPGADPVTVVVMDDDGELVACFPAQDGDDGADIPVADMAGQWHGPLPEGS